MATSTALRLEGRDTLALLHRTTTNALDDMKAGEARATLFCDFRGRLLHRAVVALTRDGAVWLLRDDAPGPGLAAAIDRVVFRDDVRIEDRSDELPVVLALAPLGAAAGVDEAGAVPREVRTGDGLALVIGGGEAISEVARIARLHPRHGHEIVDAFNPFEVGLAREVHLAKGCFTGQEALQRLITYDSVRRRPAVVRLGGPAPALPCDVLASGERAGVLTSAAGGDGLAILRRDVLDQDVPLTLAGGAPIAVVAAPEPARPLGRP